MQRRVHLTKAVKKEAKKHIVDLVLILGGIYDLALSNVRSCCKQTF